MLVIAGAAHVQTFNNDGTSQLSLVAEMDSTTEPAWCNKRPDTKQSRDNRHMVVRRTTNHFTTCLVVLEGGVLVHPVGVEHPHVAVLGADALLSHGPQVTHGLDLVDTVVLGLT